MLSSKTTTAQGSIAEEAVKLYLSKQGLLFKDQNYRCKVGEIDLVFLDPHNDTWVFVEVRQRKNNYFGSPVETVTKTKQRKIINAAKHYLVTKKLPEQTAIRFDIVGLTHAKREESFNWIQHAFYGDCAF